MTARDIPPAYVELLRALHEHLVAGGARGWLVGGYLRDLLLGHASGDLDIAVAGDAMTASRLFADRTGGAWVPLDELRNTARIVWPASAAPIGWPQAVDLAGLRATELEGDLRGRDFTINALALPLDLVGRWTPSDLVDPLGGLADLQSRLLRPCSSTALIDDPLRMLRAARFGAQLDFALTADLDAEVRTRRGLIVRVAAERVRDELLKLLALPHAGRWVRYLDEVRLLTTIIPELEPARDCDQPVVHFLPVLDHLLEAVVAAEWLVERLQGEAEPPHGGGSSDPVSGASPGGGFRPAALVPAAVRAFPELWLSLPHARKIADRLSMVVDGVPRLALFKLAVLLHDVAKPRTKAIKPDGGVSFYDHQAIGAEVAWTITRRLRLSRAGCEYVRLVVREHMRPGQLNALGPELTRRAVYRFFNATGEAGPDVLLHSLADHLSMRGPLLEPEGWSYHTAWTAMMLDMFYETDEMVRAEPILRGTDLMRELGLAPGPQIGRLLAEVREAQAEGEVRTREEALEWARRRA